MDALEFAGDAGMPTLIARRRPPPRRQRRGHRRAVPPVPSPSCRDDRRVTAFFATCPKGLEYLLRDELVALGAEEAREALAGVHFSGSLETAYRACLWSRLASRILMPLERVRCGRSPTRCMPACRRSTGRVHLAPHGTLAVDAVTVAEQAHPQPVHRAEGQGRRRRPVPQRYRRAPGRRSGRTRPAPQPAPAQGPRDVVDRPVRPAAASPRLAPRAGRGAAEGKPRRGDAAARALAGDLRRRRCAARSDVRFGHAADRRRADGRRRRAGPASRILRFARLARPRHRRCGAGCWTRRRQRADDGLRALRPCFFGSDSDPRMVQTSQAQRAGGRRRRLRPAGQARRHPHRTAAGNARVAW